MKIYQGKKPTATAQQERKKVINTLVGIVTNNSEVLSHKPYFDNFLQ